MVKQTVRYTASAEQTVRRFFYGRRVGVSTLLNHMHSNSIDTAQAYTQSPHNHIIITLNQYLDCLSGSPCIKVNIRFSCNQAARSADDTFGKAYI